MEININIDEKEIVKKIVETCVNCMYTDVKHQVMVEIKSVIVTEVRKQAQNHVAEILSNYTLPDGRSFHQYLTDLLTSGKEGWCSKPRLQTYMDEKVSSVAKELWNDLFEKQLPIMKEEIQKNLLNMTIKKFFGDK